MKKDIIKTIRVSKKTLENIESIRKQLENKKEFEEINLTDSYIIRLSLSLLNEKAKYIIWEKQK